MVYSRDFKEISTERRDEIIATIVSLVDRWKLYTPAIIALQTTKPLSFIGSQLAYFFTPVGGVFMEEEKIEDWAQILEDRENVEILIAAIEERAEEVKEEEEQRKQERRLIRKKKKESKE